IARREPVDDEVTERGGVLGTADPQPTGAFGREFALGQNGPLVPADRLNGNPRLLRNLLRRGAAPDESLDLTRTQRAGAQVLHLRPIPANRGAQLFGDGKLIALVGGI